MLRRLVEAAAVGASPIVLFVVLRLRMMAPALLPDPSMQSTYVFAPSDIFRRYTAVFTSTARLREGARVGFLIPARSLYLAFGAVPGFLVFRYLLALVAVVPAYVLLRRLYGVGAGALAVVVIMSSPVVVTAWGTDFPDSAVISYLTGGLACLVLPAATRRARAGALAAAAAFFTLAVWALATAAVLVGVALVVYLLVRLRRARRHLAADVVLLAATAGAVTVALGLASWWEIGQLDFITPTVDALRFLATPAQERIWHSSNWRWAPYDAYLLVLPALALAWLAAIGRRGRPIGSPQLLIGAVLGGELVVSVYGQFLNHVQLLEEHYFSSMLWSGALLASIVTMAELTRPLATHRVARFAPAAIVLVVPLAYEVDPHVPAFGWWPIGFVVGAVVVGGAVAGRCLVSDPNRAVAGIGGAAAVAVMTGAALVLTVAPGPAHAPLPDTMFDPAPAYASALGGSASALVADYRLTSEVPRFVGPAAYPGERLLTCWSAQSDETLSVIGLYHGSFNLLPSFCPAIGAEDLGFIEDRAAPQLLVVSEAPIDLRLLVARLATLHPVLVRHAVLRSGTRQLDLALIEIGRYLRTARA